ncbi:MAG TPA: peptidoglycan recognition family protein [Kofleriaceae bacterium]|nr:peptidoglycan recognition family protein [Kofleriaceae bacterium]
MSRAVCISVLIAAAACRSPSSATGSGSTSGSVSGSVSGSASGSGSGSGSGFGSGSGSGSGSDSVSGSDSAVDAGIDAPLATIKDWLIDWPPSRDAAMLAYRRTHTDAAATDTTIAPRMIVLHYTAGGSAKGTKQYFDRPHLEESRAKLREGGDVNVSAHFLVDQDGTIFRLLPETRMARHAIGVNHIAIGVENVGDEDKYPLTDAQIDADAALVRDLVARYPTITLLVGHHEVRSLEGTEWFVERDPTYRNKKPDPGPRFMAAVRARIADLRLDGPDDIIKKP